MGKCQRKERVYVDSKCTVEIREERVGGWKE